MLHKELRRLEHGKTIFFQRQKAIIHRNSIQFAVTDIISKFLLSLVINVSSTNSKQSKLCVKCTLYIDTRLFGKHAVRRNRPQYVYDEIVKASVS